MSFLYTLHSWAREGKGRDVYSQEESMGRFLYLLHCYIKRARALYSQWAHCYSELYHARHLNVEKSTIYSFYVGSVTRFIP